MFVMCYVPVLLDLCPVLNVIKARSKEIAAAQLTNFHSMLDWLNFHFVQIQLLWTDFQWPKNCMNPHNISHDIDMHCTCAAQWPRQIFNCAASMWLVQGPRVLPRTLQISVWLVPFCSSTLNSSNNDLYPQPRTKFSSLIKIQISV